MNLTKKAFDLATNPRNSWLQIAVYAGIFLVLLPLLFALDLVFKVPAGIAEMDAHLDPYCNPQSIRYIDQESSGTSKIF